LALAFCIPAACVSVGPDYIPPRTTVSESWHSRLENGLNDRQASTAELSLWWETFGDPELTVLINRALQNNLDIRQAVSRVREARAARSISKAGLFPAADASGSITRSHTEDNGTRTLYSTGFDALWEIDLFGGVRRSVEAADADLQASIEDLRDIHVSLAAEVALNYIEMRTYQSRLTVAESNLRNQEETYELTRMRCQAGLTDELDVGQAKAVLETTRSSMPTLRTGMEGSKNRLAVLLGIQPGALHQELEGSGPVPTVPRQVAVGVPADVLRRRPDIRKAEKELAAQTARVGVATADLYPKLKLTGSIGLESLNSGKLFSAGTGSFSFGPGISWPVFDAGVIRQNIEVQSARQEQALQSYETAVLNALEEAENKLTAYSEEQNRKDMLLKGADAAGQAFDLAKMKYQAGLTDFTTLIQAQSSLLSLQDELAKSSGTVASNLVSLYKALGGGWSSNESDNEPTPPHPSP
jgi:NodT family efflux transporter outer membrane factor (OMF) lipoprotein